MLHSDFFVEWSDFTVEQSDLERSDQIPNTAVCPVALAAVI